jgi:hypothetical protein
MINALFLPIILGFKKAVIIHQTSGLWQICNTLMEMERKDHQRPSNNWIGV